MLEQTVNFSDVPRLFALAILEILLSTDNAIVLGTLAHALPSSLRRKALLIGLISSFLLRALALLLVAFLLENRWIQILGALYLLYLSGHHFLKKQKSPALLKSPASFWKTVFLIELFDLIFAFDSILAGIAFIDSDPSRLWIVYVGGMIGLIGMRFTATLFSSLIDRFPLLERSAYLMVGWIGLKLAFSSLACPIPPPLFWSFTAFLFLLGFGKLKT